MTFVIFFSRNLAGVGRSISRGFFFTSAIFLLFGMLGAGIWIGVKLNPPAAKLVPLAAAPPMVSEPSAKELALLQQIGTLSARLMRLEMDAKSLAQRMDAVNEFEARMSLDAVPLGPRAKTQPASAGGPLLKPEKSAPNASAPESARDKQGKGGSAAAPMQPRRPLASSEPMPTDGLSVANLEQSLGRLTAALQDLEQRAVKVSAEHMAFPGRLPVASSRLGSGYGNRRDPFTFRMAFHSGIDFTAAKGTPIYASAGGVVVYSGQRKDYGQTVEIDHGAGLVTRYAHASKLIAKKGQIVMPGQLIAEVGSTGRSTGAHLHFEILKDGRFVNPKTYLNRF